MQIKYVGPGARAGPVFSKAGEEKIKIIGIRYDEHPLFREEIPRQISNNLFFIQNFINPHLSSPSVTVRHSIVFVYTMNSPPMLLRR